MNLAIIGAGNVGKSLGKRFQEAGHRVIWGVPNPSDAKYSELAVTDVTSAVRDAEVVILAVPWAAAEQAVTSLRNLDGKIMIDVVNPVAEDFSGLVNLAGSSAGEQVARWAANAKVVKAFNTVGNNVMDNPAFGSNKATMLVAGDDPEAKSVVLKLAGDIGFSPVDAGPLSMSRYMEALAWIWISLAYKQGLGRDIAFQLISR